MADITWLARRVREIVISMEFPSFKTPRGTPRPARILYGLGEPPLGTAFRHAAKCLTIDAGTFEESHAPRYQNRCDARPRLQRTGHADAPARRRRGPCPHEFFARPGHGSSRARPASCCRRDPAR